MASRSLNVLKDACNSLIYDGKQGKTINMRCLLKFFTRIPLIYDFNSFAENRYAEAAQSFAFLA